MSDADRLLAVVADILGVSLESLGPDSACADLNEWDSLAHLRILMMVEEEFGISVDMQAAGELESIAEILEYIRRKRST